MSSNNTTDAITDGVRTLRSGRTYRITSASPRAPSESSGSLYNPSSVSSRSPSLSSSSCFSSKIDVDLDLSPSPTLSELPITTDTSASSRSDTPEVYHPTLWTHLNMNLSRSCARFSFRQKYGILYWLTMIILMIICVLKIRDDDFEIILHDCAQVSQSSRVQLKAIVGLTTSYLIILDRAAVIVLRLVQLVHTYRIRIPFSGALSAMRYAIRTHIRNIIEPIVFVGVALSTSRLIVQKQPVCDGPLLFISARLILSCFAKVLLDAVERVFHDRGVHLPLFQAMLVVVALWYTYTSVPFELHDDKQEEIAVSTGTTYTAFVTILIQLVTGITSKMSLPRVLTYDITKVSTTGDDVIKLTSSEIGGTKYPTDEDIPELMSQNDHHQILHAGNVIEQHRRSLYTDRAPARTDPQAMLMQKAVRPGSCLSGPTDNDKATSEGENLKACSDHSISDPKHRGLWGIVAHRSRFLPTKRVIPPAEARLMSRLSEKLKVPPKSDDVDEEISRTPGPASMVSAVQPQGVWAASIEEPPNNSGNEAIDESETFTEFTQDETANYSDDESVTGYPPTTIMGRKKNTRVYTGEDGTVTVKRLKMVYWSEINPEDGELQTIIVRTPGWSTVTIWKQNRFDNPYIPGNWVRWGLKRLGYDYSFTENRHEDPSYRTKSKEASARKAVKPTEPTAT